MRTRPILLVTLSLQLFLFVFFAPKFYQWRHTSDFVALYAVGCLFRETGPQSIYDREAEWAKQSEVTRGEGVPEFHLYMMQPPILAPYYGLLSKLPYTTAFIVNSS